MNREAVVAGQFYPNQADILTQEMSKYIDKHAKKCKVKGMLCPHAGYVYSGKVAGAVFSKIEFPDTFIILGPNHTGIGHPFALWPEGAWETPLGSIRIDEELTGAILSSSSLIKADYQAHINEHSLEVQVPFIQYFSSSAKIVPLVLSFGTFPQLKEISHSLITAIKGTDKKIVIIASSDMTHYQPQQIAEKNDDLALSHLLTLEPKRFFETIKDSNITMCGYIPAVIMILCCKALGAKKGEVVMYRTSGEVSGDYSQVVGYAGVIIE